MKRQLSPLATSKATIGYTQDDYKSALNQTYNTNTGNETTDYYNALKNESYKSLLNSEVQASIARDQAMKYTTNSLRAKGYANQGLAESTNLGLQSQYHTALANAKNTYQQSIDNINTQQRTEALNTQKDNFESMTTLMSGATDSSQLNDIMSTYGYGNIDSNGNMNWSGLDESNLDENSKKQIKTLYNLYNAQLNNTSSLDSLDALGSATYVGKDGKVHTLGEFNKEEMKFLWHKGSNGEYSKGDTIKINNGNGDTIYMQWTGSGFKVVNKVDFNKAANKHTLTWNSGSDTITYN